MSLVIVDDSLFNLDLLEAILQPLGRPIVRFRDPLAALDGIESLEPVLVVTDHLMPEMEGVELVRRLRSMPAVADVPVLMLTSADENAVRVTAFEVGVTDFATRPIDPIELRARARALMQLGIARNELRWQARMLAGEVQDTTANLATVLDSGPGTLSRFARDASGAWRPVWHSDNFSRLTGYTLAEASAPDFSQHTMRVDPYAGRAEALARSSAPGMASWDFDFRHKHGHWLRLGQNLRVVISGAYEEELVAYTYDFTAQYQAAKLIEAGKQRLDMLLSASPGALFQMELNESGAAAMVFMADAIVRVTGYRFDAMPGGCITTLYDEMSLARHADAIASARLRGEASYEAHLQHKDGRWIWADVRLSASEGPASMRITGYIADVTGERETRAELERTRTELKAVVEASPGALVTLLYGPSATDKAVLFASHGIARVTGYSAEECRDPAWFQSVVDPAYWRDMMETRWQLLQLRPAIVQLPILHKSGGWRWVQLAFRPHERSADGKVLVFGYMTDITEQKAQDARLAQTVKLATLGEMATSMAHELNQPLTIISFAAQNLFNAYNQDEQARPRLDRIIAQAHRASKLIDHLRVFGRAQDSAPSAVHWQDALAGAMLLAGAKLRMAGITPDVRVPDDLPPVQGHLVLLEQVLLNVINNACDAYQLATPPVPGADRTLVIAAEAMTGAIRMTVADRAGGIPPAAMERVFEPFFTTKAASQGTGLGLSFSYGVIADMKGSMTVRNAGGGAEFEIILPIATLPIFTESQ